MEAKTTICPSCGGRVVFDPSLGKVKCEFCGSEFTPAKIDEAWGALGEDAPEPVVLEEFGADELRSYTCSGCGAEMMADPNTVVLLCPYCGNHNIVPAQFSGSLRPNFIIPFSYTKEQAMEKYKEFTKNRFLLPMSFLKEGHVEEMQGVYVPFWMFDGRANITGDYLANDKSHDNGSDVDISDVISNLDPFSFKVHREGYMNYRKVPADASRRMEDKFMDSIEPYELDKMKKFSPSYLPGFLAERYDVSMEECRERAHERIENTMRTNVRKTIDHNTIQHSNEDFEYTGEQASYAMFPVWMLATRWGKRVCKFAMNAQTGKIVGDLPVSPFKMMAIQIPLFLGLMFIGLMILGAVDAKMPAGLIAYMIFPIFVCVFVGVYMYSNMKSVKTAESAWNYMPGSLKLTGSTEEVVGIAGARKFMKEKEAQKGLTPAEKKNKTITRWVWIIVIIVIAAAITIPIVDTMWRNAKREKEFLQNLSTSPAETETEDVIERSSEARQITEDLVREYLDMMKGTGE